MDAARQSKAVSMMGYMRAYDPGTELIRDRISRMGEPKLARSRNFGGTSLSHEGLFNIVRPKPDEYLTAKAGNIINAGTSKLLEEAVGPDPKLQRLYWSLLMGATHDLSILRTVLGRPKEVIYSYIDDTRIIGCLAFNSTVCQLEWETAGGYEWWDQETTFNGTTGAFAILPKKHR